MTLQQFLLDEFEREVRRSRHALEQVPEGKYDWKPHDRSMLFGYLADLVATMPGWIANMARATELNLADSPGYSLQSTESLLATFDKLVAEARSAIAGLKDADIAVPWSLKHGDRVLFTSPRGETIRSTVNHLIHHRGQLTVYLRLIDVPVPSIYGPTADEGWGT